MIANILLTILYAYLAVFGAGFAMAVIRHTNNDSLNLWMAVTALLFVGVGGAAISKIWL